MAIAVPTKRRPAARVPAAGAYAATLLGVTEDPPGRYEAKWRFTAKNANDPGAKAGQYTLPQALDEGGLGDMLHDLGFAGQDVEIEDLAGTKARVVVRTFGGRTSARVVRVLPIGV